MPEAPILAARNLTAPLGLGDPALQGAEFSLARGERVILRGPSGAGKSTLLRSLVLLEPAEGEVSLDGRVVGPTSVRELRRRVGYLPQQPVPVAPTVKENLAFPRDLATGGVATSLDEAAQLELLSRLGLADLDLSRRFTTLSGGEQQRLALVRSLTPGPEVLLLDEPTASLDRENVADVLALIREWCEADAARALVWVSHHAGELDDFATRAVDVRALTGGVAS